MTQAQALALDRCAGAADRSVSRSPRDGARRELWSVTAPVDVAQLDVGRRCARSRRRGRRSRSSSRRRSSPRIRCEPTRRRSRSSTAPLSIPAERPAGAVRRGGLEVTLRAELGDGLDGVREYMSWYPYTCLEQQLSRAVALRDARLWDAWIARLPAYLDRDGLLQILPDGSARRRRHADRLRARDRERSGLAIPASTTSSA